MNALSNPESEKVVLGLCLQDAERLYEATSGIKPEDFSLDSHRKIFSCMADMAATGKSVDYMTVANELGSKRELGSVGGAAYLSSLTEGCVGSLSYHLRVLRDKARRRLLVTACNRGLSAAEDITAETTACISAVEEALLQIEAESGGKNDFHISEFLPDVLEQLQAKAAGNDHYGFSTGIADLDHSLGLLRPGELVVVGALPSRGKTAISLQILGANAINNIPVKDFSLEMTRNQIGNRLLAAHSTISANRIRRPELIGDEGWPMLLKATEQLIEWPLYVDDSASLTLQELTSRARLSVRRNGVKLVVVDYLRLVRSKGRDLREKVGNVADGLRQLAKNENICVVLLSQLARPGDINERPTMLSLKESGDIEAHANIVLLLYMPVDNKNEPTGQDEIIIGKSREGPLGAIPVLLHKARLQFMGRVVTA